MHPLTASDELNRLAEDFWQQVVADSPTFATVLGDRRYDGRLDDPRPEALADLARRRRATAAAARGIDPAALTTAERVTRQMLIDEAEGHAALAGSGLQAWTVDPMEGPQTHFLNLVEYQSVTTPADGEAMVERWRAMGPYLDLVIANLRRSASEGRLAVRTPVAKTIDILERIEATPVEDWKLAEPGDAPHADWSDADVARFREGLFDAVSEVVAPAFQRYRQVLQAEILPASRSTDRPGLVNLPGGAEAYRALVRVHTTLDLEPEAIHETGLREMDRIDGEFVELGGRLLGTRDLATTLAALRDDPKLRFETSGEVFSIARRSLERAVAAIPDWFGRLPQAACDVVPVPTHAAPHQTIAYYAWPAVDGSRPGRYYINLHAPETRPRYEAEVLAFHEAVPGHHLQIAIAQELEGIPAFQRLLGSTAFSEGWGLYTERLSDEMGLYSGDLDRFGILSFDAWRAGRLVVDTGMHALGWSRDKAIEYLRDHTALGFNNIDNEVDRYIVWPGQALAYKIGQLEILRLRQVARERLGSGFEIKGFHDAVLGSGAVSLGTLGQIVDGWVTERAGATS